MHFYLSTPFTDTAARGAEDRLTRAHRQLPWVALIILFAMSSASAQSTGDLQQQLDELKQQYEQMADLQRRIIAFEQL